MNKIIKKIIYKFFFIISKFIKSNDIGVLMYHSIDDSDWKLNVNIKDFNKQIGYLIRNYKIVKLDDVVKYVKGETILDKKSIALTFDDGFESMYYNVFPLVKKFNFPITIFLTTNLESTAKSKNLPRLNWEQIKEMSDSGLVSFQVHGHNHLNLKNIIDNQDKLAEEVLYCRNIIAEKLSITPKYMAYAFGHKNDKVVEFIKKSDFKAAFTINEGLINKGDDLFNIKRTQIDRTMNFCLFKMRLTKAVDLNRKFIDFIRKKIWKKISV